MQNSIKFIPTNLPAIDGVKELTFNDFFDKFNQTVKWFGMTVPSKEFKEFFLNECVGNTDISNGTHSFGTLCINSIIEKARIVLLKTNKGPLFSNETKTFYNVFLLIDGNRKLFNTDFVLYPEKEHSEPDLLLIGSVEKVKTKRDLNNGY